MLLQDHPSIDKPTVTRLLAEIILSNTAAANKNKNEKADFLDVPNLKKSKKDFEKQMFALLHGESNANKIQIAKKLGISRTTLWRKLREHGFSHN